MSRTIKKVAVLGSGVMGSRIACHFANAGNEVLLLDIIPSSLLPEEEKVGLTLDHPRVRNRIAEQALAQAIKSNPSPLYSQKGKNLISTGNFEDHFQLIADCDWIIEAVVERLDIKQKIFEKADKHRKTGSVVSSNTSGIPIHLMTEGRSDNFRKCFLGTHFFNPPRYLPLLEIIPGTETDHSIIELISSYGELNLGKTVIHCKDTPAFIANRIGVYSIMALFHLVEKNDLTVDEVDALTGTLLFRPKSATFRTCDVVGLDTLVHVANGLYKGCPDDEQRDTFLLPGYIQKMNESKWLGDKTGQGFFKKVKNESGKTDILSLDLKTLEYKPRTKLKLPVVDQAKTIDDYGERLKLLLKDNGKAGEFYRQSFYGLFSYVAHRIPEISDDIFKIDDALKAGFGWEYGPFETWQKLGIADTVSAMQRAGFVVPPWIDELLSSSSVAAFYQNNKGQLSYYIPVLKEYKTEGKATDLISISLLKGTNTVWSNSGCSIIDIGDGIICCEFHTKLNTIGSEIIEGVNRAISIAEKDFKGLVIGNESVNFSAGANLAMVFMMAIEQDYDEIDLAIRAFQQMNMRVRYSSIPVVGAPSGMTLGGGCEMNLHADKVQAHAELYMGMVEFGVGLIPGGGGTKEFVVRLSDSIKEGDIEINALRERFLTIGQAKVSTSAVEAFDLGLLRKGHDMITMNRKHLIADAKRSALELADAGYVQPVPRKDIKVLGKSGLGVIWAGANTMVSGHYITEHDQLISQKLGYIMCGGELSAPSFVSEQYLLDLEREAFLSLCGEKKTLERIQAILSGGKPLRN